MRVCKQSTARTIAVFITQSADHVSGLTGATLTITASKNGAAFASITPTVTELANGWYSLALTTAHTDTLGDLALHITATSADPTDLLMQVVAYDMTDATALGLSRLDAAISSVATSVWSFAHQSGRTVKGAIKRLDQLLTGKHTGLLGSTWAMYDVDGVTKLVEAAQDTVAGTRTAATTVAGD